MYAPTHTPTNQPTHAHTHAHTHEQRPTAGELLKHKFLRQARKTSYLCELVERFVRWKLEMGEDALSLSSHDTTE